MRVMHFREVFSLLSETFLYDYVTEMASRAGVQVDVAAFDQVLPDERPFDPVHCLPLLPRWSPRRAKETARTWWLGERRDETAMRLYRPAFGALLARVRPDVVHAHFGTAAVWAMPVTQELGIPLVATFYGFDISRLPRQAAWRERYRELWQRAAAITALSEVMKAKIVALGCPADKVHVVHLGKRTGDYVFRPRTGPVRHLVSVGRLSDKKGHADLIAALSEVPDLTLRIVGDGALREPLQRQIAAAGLQDRVTLVGSLPHAEVKRELDEADAFVLTSRIAADGDEEGTPTVLMEALALGIPTISTQHAGIPEIIPSEDHRFLAPERDVAAIAQCLRTLVASTPAQRVAMATRGRTRVEREFNVATEVSAFLRLYERL